MRYGIHLPHAGEQATSALIRRHAKWAEDLGVDDVWVSEHIIGTVANVRDARVSIHHCAAVAFLFGDAGLREFAEPIVHDPAVVALRTRTKARLDAKSPRGAATATVHTVDGRVLETTVLHARGSTQIPLTDQELGDKVRGLVNAGGFASSADDMIAAVWQLDTFDSLTSLLHTLPAQ